MAKKSFDRIGPWKLFRKLSRIDPNRYPESKSAKAISIWFKKFIILNGLWFKIILECNLIIKWFIYNLKYREFVQFLSKSIN